MKRLIAAAFCCVLAAALLAGPAIGNEPFAKPKDGTTVVPSRPINEDYKNNPAPPEPPGPPSRALSEAEIKAIMKSIDPEDSPHILVCVNADGSGSADFVHPGARGGPEVAPPPGIAKKKFTPVNDKGRCD